MPPFMQVLNEPVAEPQPIDSMAGFVSCLRAKGYTLKACAARLGCHPRLGVNFFEEYRPAWRPAPDDAVDVLIALLIAGHEVAIDRCRTMFSAAFVDDGMAMRLLVRDGDHVRSPLCLFPCYGRYLATDRAHKNLAINQVMYLWSESYILGGVVNRPPGRMAVDLCTGSGIHAILAAGHCDQVVGVDINPRAVAFARFNQRLNGLDNVAFVLGDLWDPVNGRADLLIANPPYAPDRAAQAGQNFWSGGPSGTELLERVIAGIPDHLADRGVCNVVALYPNPPGTRTKDYFDLWLGGELTDYDVLDFTWRVPGWSDPMSVDPVSADTRAYMFGVVSLRRAAARGRGHWRHVGSGSFFNASGECRVTADHDAVASRG